MAEKKRGPGRPKGSKNKNTTSRKTASVNISSEKDVRTQDRVKDEVATIVLLALGAFFLISMHTSFCGIVGEAVSNCFKGLFGYGGYVIPYLLILYAILIFVRATPPLGIRTVLLLLGFYLSVDLIITAGYVDEMQYGIIGIKNVYTDGTLLNNGGVFGMYVGNLIWRGIGIYGLYIAASVIAVVCLLLLVNTPISGFLQMGKDKKQARAERKAEKILAEEEAELKRLQQEEELKKKREAIDLAGRQTEIDYRKPSERAADFAAEKAKSESGEKAQDESWKSRPITDENKQNIINLMKDDKILGGNGEESSVYPESEDNHVEPAVPTGYVANTHEDSGVTVTPTTARRYKLPGIDLLSLAKSSPIGSTFNVNDRASQLESTLRSFNVAAKVINVTQGPSVTRYEIQPAQGVKVSSIVKLENDIALNMEAKSIRIEAPIPGKPAVGIEIENSKRDMVTLREIIGSNNFKAVKSKIAFSVGKDIEGNAVISDLYKMPHLLVAGATGSGKSVFINAILMSILYKAKPEEVKLILIDPKMVELGQYNDIPHLLVPVVTDATKAASALNWAVHEMMSRYKKFAAVGVKDMNNYNRIMKDRKEKSEIMPQVVIVIDELADLMMVASAQVEDAICRLAQMARAAGMHLIVATQRPSVDVITGLIKANIPSRVAFLVSSQVDSRTILDMPGAEKLAGDGDMLFNPQGTAKQPRRVQGAFVSDEEVQKVIAYVKSQMSNTEYDTEVIEQIEKGNTYDGDSGSDELLTDAIEMVVRAGQASTSMLQRRFRIGYNRAARIIDMMEERGIIGPSEGSKPRQVIMTEAEFERMKEESEKQLTL